MSKFTLAFGVTYHGSTPEHLEGLDNAYGKHISAANLREHLRWFMQRFHVIGMAEMLKQVRNGALPPRNSLFIVFHDGYRGNYDVAYPLLKEFGLKATFFPTTDFMGTARRFWVDILDAAVKYSERKEIAISSYQTTETLPLEGDADRLETSLKLRRKLKTLSAKAFEDEFDRIIPELGYAGPGEIPRLGDHEACLNWDMVREMSTGGMEFGSHTHCHVICARQREAVVREEMVTSKTLLEQEIGQPCDLFCYPNGFYPRDGNDATDRLAFEIGYKHVLYMAGPYNLLHPGIFRLTGIAFGEESDQAELRRTLSKRRFWRKKLFRGHIWPWDEDSLDT